MPLACFCSASERQSKDQCIMQPAALITSQAARKVLSFDVTACAPGQAQLARVLDQRKVLIVIDDTNDHGTQINMLLPKGCLHPGALVLITSRDRDVLMERCSDVHEVSTLHQVLAMQLFAACTFPTGHPPMSLAAGLVSEVVAACAGLPLTLKVSAKKLPLPDLTCAEYRCFNVECIWG